MSQAIVGRWGKSLAVRVPYAVAQAAGLTDGEQVEVEALDGDIIIRRPATHASARQAAEAAAAEIVAESRRHSLGDAAIRDLLDEGRRG
ncbi:MAG: AbrB/MazE/SpoVT family DNA-binding domain-containing protein [Acetobacteraceae bacterium]|nr:AbrB/MazE/SpoVT family DNA-binding domain-containing protein [Acetobacteraceae bacterium]